VESKEPEASKSDAGEKEHEKTKSIWPRNSTSASPAASASDDDDDDDIEEETSHKRNVLSSEAVARYIAEGDHETSLIPRM
jgi:hypothetical protein